MWTFRSQEATDNPEKEYRERTLWDPLVEPLLDLATETESHELLVEVTEENTRVEHGVLENVAEVRLRATT